MYIKPSTVDTVEASIPSMANSAVVRCCHAWMNAYREEFENSDEISATRVAALAYRTALPSITTRENCRDFVACVAHGLLLEVINEKESTKLIYAVQTALSALAKHHQPGTPSAAKNHPARRSHRS